MKNFFQKRNHFKSSFFILLTNKKLFLKPKQLQILKQND